MAESVEFVKPDEIELREPDFEEASANFRRASEDGTVECADEQEVFFPPVEYTKNGRQKAMTADQLRAMQAICAECVVYEDCRVANRGEPMGVFAGINQATSRSSTRRRQDEATQALRRRYLANQENLRRRAG